jgi:hypothetical protein
MLIPSVSVYRVPDHHNGHEVPRSTSNQSFLYLEFPFHLRVLRAKKVLLDKCSNEDLGTIMRRLNQSVISLWKPIWMIVLLPDIPTFLLLLSIVFGSGRK